MLMVAYASSMLSDARASTFRAARLIDSDSANHTLYCAIGKSHCACFLPLHGACYATYTLAAIAPSHPRWPLHSQQRHWQFMERIVRLQYPPKCARVFVCVALVRTHPHVHPTTFKHPQTKKANHAGPKSGQLANIFTHFTLANYQYLPIKCEHLTYVTMCSIFLIYRAHKGPLCAVYSAPYGQSE